MKLGEMAGELDGIDLRILALCQENCKLPLAKVGEKVGLSAPAVIERIKKLEEHGVILGYRAILDSRKLGRDVIAFIGVSITHPKRIVKFEAAIDALEDVLECHHVTGEHTFLLKVKTEDTSSLERLISTIRSIDGVECTETTVVLSTHSERTQLPLRQKGVQPVRRSRRNGDKQATECEGNGQHEKDA
jgi:Lrp/AsnC family leucine-responsive transcriptional regulator